MKPPVATKKWLAILEVTLAVIAWGGSFVATKYSLRYVQPVTVIWLRFAMGVPILALATGLRKQFQRVSGKDLLYFAAAGFIGITFHQWLQSTALETTQASTTAWIVATIPMFSALMGWLFLKERLWWLQVAGIVLAAAGVLVVITNGDLYKLVTGHFGTVGDVLVLISAPNWAFFSVISRRGLHKFPAAFMMTWVMFFGWLFTTVHFVLAQGYAEIGKLALDGWTGVAFLGVICSGLAYIFWYDALQALPVAQTGAFIYLEPLVTVVVAALVLGEPLLGASLAGGAIILAGIWMVNRPAKDAA